ncbi:MAG: Mo-dependent nitrogenase C-terminal domain-containing protein [Pseudanabaenaceae cyanobacterium SKYGB_i_bin29]|nr:Mo-dependent nitrogenase C-terminal domain-containing protein [Pseudanabaenaceae cyanobacterium SKYG29]MDW8422231.1 Mo-dependent nitrogenase C-terminal domain-containing protein [Pseudanabaenaceae cyanobacterium SKYGB_i_bin29]
MHTLVLDAPRDWLHPLRQAINSLQVHRSVIAHWICRLIPSHCPLERTFHLGKYRLHIPPLCHLNPLYGEIIALRMRALEYLMVLEVDVSAYLEA